MSVLILGVAGWGCVEQEPSRPTEEDKRIVKESLLVKSPENLKYKVNAELEGKVIYLGLEVDQELIQPGQRFTLTHYWKVIKRVEGWNIFVHLSGPNNADFINADHTPVGGRYPVASWKAGDIIRDAHDVSLPETWKNPLATVYTGLWKGPSRMKIKGPQDEQSRIIAAQLKVKVPESAAAAPVAPKKRLVAWKTKKPMKIDGLLKEEAWSQAAGTGPFVETMKGEPVADKTEVKAVWDDKFLYLSFQCQDQDVWSSLKKRDDQLWTQEVVEAFIDANADQKDYIELQVNPNGAIFDSYLPAYRKNQNEWNSKMKAAVKVEGTLNKREDKDQGWTVEMAIPWSDVKGRAPGARETAPPKFGDLYRVNFFRFDFPQGKQAIASAWSPPLVGDFHVLDKFGELVFADLEGKVPEEKVHPTAPAGQALPATTGAGEVNPGAGGGAAASQQGTPSGGGAAPSTIAGAPPPRAPGVTPPKGAPAIITGEGSGSGSHQNPGIPMALPNAPKGMGGALNTSGQGGPQPAIPPTVTLPKGVKLMNPTKAPPPGGPKPLPGSRKGPEKPPVSK
jgi:hypothetical protein